MSDDMWTYRPTSGHIPGTDLTGFKVEATDGSIGKVDKHSNEVGDQYIVVDTGVWIFGKEVLLPAGTITGVNTDDKVIQVSRTKDEIKSARSSTRTNTSATPGTGSRSAPTTAARTMPTGPPRVPVPPLRRPAPSREHPVGRRAAPPCSSQGFPPGQTGAAITYARRSRSRTAGLPASARARAASSASSRPAGDRRNSAP